MIDNELETELRGVFARAGADVDVPPQTRARLIPGYYPGSARRKVAAGITAAAVVAGGAATAVATLGPANHPPPAVQLAAWTVVTKPDGNVVLTIRELRHPGRLQHKLRANGVPASVSVGFRQNPSCRRFPVSHRRAEKVFPISHQRPPSHAIRVTIHPAALPKGAGVQLFDGAAGVQRGKGFTIGFGLVHVSKRCTGG